MASLCMYGCVLVCLVGTFHEKQLWEARLRLSHEPYTDRDHLCLTSRGLVDSSRVQLVIADETRDHLRSRVVVVRRRCLYPVLVDEMVYVLLHHVLSFLEKIIVDAAPLGSGLHHRVHGLKVLWVLHAASRSVNADRVVVDSVAVKKDAVLDPQPPITVDSVICTTNRNARSVDSIRGRGLL